MSVTKLAGALDPVVAAFEHAPDLGEPLSAEEEEEAVRAALASGDEGITTPELLERIRPKK